MTTAVGSSDKSADELSQNDWLAIQLPKEILRHGGKLAHHFRTLALDAPEEAKREILRKLDTLKREATKEIPPGVFDGNDLDRIRIFNFSNDTAADLKTFQTSTPSAVLREVQFSQTPVSANNYQVTCLQESYCFQTHLDLLARCVQTPSRQDANADSTYPVSAHDPAIFPEKLFSLASCRLQLEMLSSFRQINPTFYRNGMRVLIRTVLECPPQALQRIVPKTAEAAILQSMFEFCTHVVDDADSTPAEKVSALSLLLALGESSGLAHHLLVVVESLLLNRIGAEFPDDNFSTEVTHLVTRFESYRANFELGSIQAKVIKTIRLQEDDDSVCGTIASDGKYIYAFSGQGLSKLGTGYHGTILGNVYATQPLSTFMEWLGWSNTNDIHYFVYLVHVHRKLFVWFVRRDDESTMSPFMFELSDADLDMVARDCDDAGTVELIESARNVEFCSDGLYMYVVASTPTSLAWRKVDPANNWKCFQHEVLHFATNVPKEAHNLLTGDVLPFFYTNGHYLIGTIKRDTTLYEVSIALATSTVHVASVESALVPNAICFDACNNLLWSTSSKSVLCHPNTGTHVILRPERLLDADIQAELNQPLTSRIVGLRILVQLERIVDSHLPDDINQMDVSDDAAAILFGVDVDASTFKSLIEIVSYFAALGPSLPKWQEFVILVCLKMLSLNTLHWLVHKKKEIADVVLNLNFPVVLKALVATSPNPRIVEAARLLFVLSIDIFHPTVSAQWQLLVSYVEKLHDHTLAPEERSVVELVVDRLSSKRKTQEAVQEAASKDFDGMQWFEKLVALSVANVKHLLVDSTDTALAAVGQKLTHLVYSVVHGILGGVSGKIVPVSVLQRVFSLVVHGCVELCDLDVSAHLEVLETSIVGEVAASFVGFTQVILDGQFDDRDKWEVASLKDMAQQLLSLLKKVVPLIDAVPKDEREQSIDVQYVGKSSVEMESAHEYSNDMHELKELRLDGATSMTITFDSRSRTELNYDYVTFYHDRTCTAYYGEEKYSGRDSSYNWPGVGHNPPLVIESDSCYVLFHSDGSTVDWGFKFTAVANVCENNMSLELHWLVAVEVQISNLLTTIATIGPKWMPLEWLETEQHQFLDCDLLHGGIDTSEATEVSVFLNDLIELNSPDTPAAHLAKILKQHTIQDQGTVAHINRAVRAVAAAMLHHNMWSVDAYALGQSRHTDPNPSLLKAWKNAQKMRNWFDLGDAKRATRKPDEAASATKPKLSRQPSAYVGASDDALRKLCANVEERAKFLLSLAPASFSLATESEDPMGAKKRWNLLAQYGTSLKKGDSTTSLLKKWHSLVDEVEAATELKRKMLYRKQSAGRHQGCHEKTVTELVLEFVQSDVVVGDLAAAVALRNRRAQFRLLSLTILYQTSEISRNNRLQHNLLERFVKSISDLDTNKVHFLTHTHGCSLSLRNNARSVFSKCLEVFTNILRTTNAAAPCTPNLLTSVLKCVAMDYDLKDAHLIFKSDVIPAVFNLLLSSDERVRKTAQATARVFLERFMVKEKESNLQKQLCTCVQHYLDCVHKPAGAGVFLPMEGSLLNSDAPFVSLGVWVYVPQTQWRQLRQGDRVVKGPQWKDTENVPTSGVVLAIHGNDLSVEWEAHGNTKAKKGFHKFDADKNMLEVIPVDQDPSGQILLRTNHTHGPWGEINLRLTTELKIEGTVSLGPSQSATLVTAAPVRVDQWHYVSFGRNGDSLTLTIDGTDTVEETLHSVLQSHDSSLPIHVVETPHPFHGQAEQWSMFPVSIPHAKLVRVTFDPQSNLTQASNYVAIYLDETMECVYGENMYNQAFSNFPGVGDNPALDVPSGEFVVGLFTEDTSELWGFRMTVQVVESTSPSPNTNKMYQVYFGEAPRRVSNQKAAKCYIEDFELLEAPPTKIPAKAPAAVIPLHGAEMCIHALSLISMCLFSQNEYGSQVIAPPAPLSHVLDLAFASNLPVSVRCCAATVMSHFLSHVQVDLQGKQQYITKAFASLATMLDLWGKKRPKVQLSAASAMWLASCYAAFLRACCHQIDLGSDIAPTLMQMLQDKRSFDQVLSALAVMGGMYDGVFVGSRVNCLVKADSIEVGTVLQFDVFGNKRTARVLLDMDMTKVDSFPLDKLSVAPQCPNYLNVLYDRLTPYLNALVDVLHGLNSNESLAQLDAQARLMKAINFLFQHLPQSSVIPSLRPSLMELALLHQEGVFLREKPTTHVYESLHPYRDGQDVYQTIVMSNAKLLKITFDPASRTEQGCDYVTFYKDESHSERWGNDTYSGRDGSENFPGFGGRSALEIPADSFVLHWHSDSSNNDWGYKFTVEAVYSDISSTSFTLDELSQRMYHLSEIMYEQPQHTKLLPRVVPLEATSHLHKKYRAVDTDALLYLKDEQSVDWEVGIAEWTVHEQRDEDSPEIITMRRGNVVTVLEFDDEKGWVRVKYVGLTGWCKVKEPKSLHRVSRLPSSEFSMRIPGWNDLYTSLPKPDELVVTKRDDADKFKSHFDVDTIEFQSGDAYTTLLREFSQSMAIKYAKDCLRSYLSSGLKDDVLPVDTFVQLAQLFALEKNTIGDTLGQRLKILAAHTAFANDIVSLYVAAVDAFVQSLPRGRILTKTVHDMLRDSVVKIHFPGATSIRLAFDKESHCHESDEFVRVYDQRDVVGSKYQGPKGSSWPGVGETPPLVVKSDTVTVNFEYVSDTGGTRLIKFTAYAEYDDDEETKTPPPKPDELASLHLACWVFRALASSQTIPRRFVARVLDLTMQLYQFMPEDMQIKLIDVWASFLTDVSIFQDLTAHQIKTWCLFVKNKLCLQFESEVPQASVLLKRLVQVVVDMDFKLDDYLLQAESLSDTFTNFEFVATAAIKPLVENGMSGVILPMNGPVLVRTTQGLDNGLHAWDVFIKTMKSRISIGLASSDQDRLVSAYPDEFALKQGDVIGFEVDLHLKLVTFKRNNAVLTSKPLVGEPLSTLYPAVVLLHQGDEVLIQKQAPLRCVRKTITESPWWYAKIVKSVRLLRGLNSVDSPSTVDISGEDTEVNFPGAKKLHVALSYNSALDPEKSLQLTSCGKTVVLDSANNLLATSPYVEKNVAPTSVILKRVSRGSDWQYGNDDGGPGNIGVILSLESWGGVAKSAVRVQWLDNNITGIYRYGFHGRFDVDLVSPFAAPSSMLLVDGETLQIQAKPKTTVSPLFKGSLSLDGTQHVVIRNLTSLQRDFTIQFWLKLDKVKPCSIFCITSDENAWWMSLSVTSSHELAFTIGHVSEESMAVSVGGTLEEWHRFEVCAAGSLISIHADSKMLGHERLPSKLNLDSSPASLSFGAGPTKSTPAHKLTGHVFGLRIWNAPLHLRELAEFFVNDERHLTEECPTFDQLVVESTLLEVQRPVQDIPRAIVSTSQAMSAMTFDNHSMHFASLRPKYLGVISPLTTPTKVYYEVTFFTAGCVQVGWSFKDCAPAGATSGIGDCKLSYGLNTVAQSKWHGEREHISEVPWQAGDVLGCMLDWDAGVMTFSVNGRLLDNISFKRGGGNCGRPTQEINSPTASMLGGLWGDDEEEDNDDENDGDDVHDGSDNSDQILTAQDEALPDDSVVAAVAADERGSPSVMEASFVGADQVEIELEPSSEPAETEGSSAMKPATTLTTPIDQNEWLQRGGIFPSLSLRSADCIRWNFGHTPMLHCPADYVPIAEATQYLERTVVFEKYDFEEKKWQDVAFRHRVNEQKPSLEGEWLCQDGHGNRVVDSSPHKRHGTIVNATEKTWTSNVLPPSSSSSVGYALKVRPLTVKARSVLTEPSLFEPVGVPGRQKEYLEMVRYVNSVCTSRSMSLAGLLSSKWSSLAPDADTLLRWPTLAELTEKKADLPGRFDVLLEFNKSLRESLGLVELTSTASLATQISKARGYIFGLVKHELWDFVMEQTKAATSPDMALTLNRPKASRWKQSSNDFNRFALFAQAYREMIHWVPSTYCRSTNLYVVTFLGENSIDAGGPYRETLSQYCVELQSSQLPLLLPAPNGQHNVGSHRDAWVLHPNAHQHHSGMLIFLGKLLGVAIRTKYCMSLTLSQVVWKLLVQDPITLDDLEAIDTLVVSSMRSLRTIEQSGVTEEMFADIIHETMTTLSTDNRQVDLVEGGDAIPVTFATRHKFADLVESYRMHEFDAAAAYLRQGLGMVVSLRLLRLFTWMELEALVCGTPDVDIDLLEKCTEYSSCSPTNQHVVWFWEVLREYNQEARQAFLRFVWGRSRLPRSVQEFQAGQQFKLQAFERHPADMYMPVSHTCFFSLELPRYTSRDVLSSRLTYAIYNCIAIDGDTNTMQANQLGWED
ncbi:hypothetical protein H310_02903 [Aphanomyces invadans]|uniref:HECT domain-containing protein n=1 Tax=Aphanomyces invadans TaxID=157072 RepID=A0A024UM83_9STRA|nr:hypothetical protein H310_02903 [Aphanomyces invadans]ETW06738.1 hypothetical protein H310_02903 [Aphanomyces invadans]|eukprot:XP_008864813.1 hypothetical protein H310_02903 [Aphanomyces invadans]